MVAFDAEVYLRRLGERLLDDSDQQQPGHRSALRGAAGALVWVGAVGADRAWRVIDDYATATHIRSGKPGFVHAGAPLRRHQAEGLPPRQFRVIDQEISVGETEVLVRDLAMTAEGGTLRYRRYLAGPGPGQVSRLLRRPRFAWNETPPDIIDSEGHRPEVRFGDGGRHGEGFVDGELELRGAIAPEAGWLEIDGTRVDLTVVRRAGGVGIEALEDRSPVERFLWRHLAVAVPRSGVIRDLEPMIEALVAAGALPEGVAAGRGPAGGRSPYAASSASSAPNRARVDPRFGRAVGISAGPLAQAHAARCPSHPTGSRTPPSLVSRAHRPPWPGYKTSASSPIRKRGRDCRSRAEGALLASALAGPGERHEQSRSRRGRVSGGIDNRTLRGRPLAATDSGGRAASDPNDHRTFARALGAGSGAESISL
jgi:hypothetical protein